MESTQTKQRTQNPIAEATLKFSGYGYLLGDAALFAHGIYNRQYNVALTGLSWGVGGLALALYGKQSHEYQLKRLTQDLGAHLQRKGYALDESAPLAQAAAKRQRPSERLERFLYDHPSQILNANYLLGSSFLLRSGLKKADYWEAASGALVGTGALGGLLIKEEEQDIKQPTIRFMDNPVGWFQEKPLRFPALLYTLNNVTLARSGFNEMRAAPANKSYLLKYLTVASYIGSNTLLGLSHQNRDNEKDFLSLDALERLASDAIASLKPEQQIAALHETAAFLAAQPNVTENIETITGQLQRLAAPQVAEREYDGRLDESPSTSISIG